MDNQEFIEELKAIIGSFLKEQNIELVDFFYHYEGGGSVLKVKVDRLEGGITMDECAALNRDIGDILDQKDIMQNRYILEVSSPGLDRPLKTKADFSRCIDRNIKFFLNDFINGKLEWDGIIIRADDFSVSADINGNIVEIPLEKIAKAKQIINSVRSEKKHESGIVGNY